MHKGFSDRPGCDWRKLRADLYLVTFTSLRPKGYQIHRIGRREWRKSFHWNISCFCPFKNPDSIWSEDCSFPLAAFPLDDSGRERGRVRICPRPFQVLRGVYWVWLWELALLLLYGYRSCFQRELKDKALACR